MNRVDMGMGWALALLLLQDPYEDPKKEIQWARSWEQGFEESRIRNVPVWIFVTSDT
jgi:hypothetical protein